jgi:AcrR family transcriptional regulator
MMDSSITPPPRRAEALPGTIPGGGLTKRRAETQSRLLAAASLVFAERGFGRATVEDVCERAGYSRGAFYSNFDSLDELFFALYSARSAELIDAVRRVVEVMPDRLSLTQVIDRVITVLPISRDSHLLNLEFAAHALRHRAVAAALAGHRRAARQALTPILRAGLTAVDAGFGGNYDHLARSLIAVQDGMFLQELLEPDDTALPALRRQLLAQVLRMPRTAGLQE